MAGFTLQSLDLKLLVSSGWDSSALVYPLALDSLICYSPPMPSREKLAEFTAWCRRHLTGDETFRSGTLAQIFLDRLFQAFHQARGLDVGGATEPAQLV